MARSPLFKALISAIHSQKVKDSSDPKRRAFLKKSLLIGAGLLADGIASARSDQVNPKKTQEPVTIAGGGLAALVTAYRLAKAGIPAVIYEASKRLGGRIQTEYAFNSEQQHCEVGGEFIDSNHEAILKLVAELAIGLDDHEDSLQAGLPAELFYFRGAFYSQKELAQGIAPLIKQIQKDVKRHGIKDIPTYRRPYLAHAFDNISLADYLDRVPEIEDWVRALIEVAYLTEFGLDIERQSALNMITMLSLTSSEEFSLFGDSDMRFRVTGGNTALVEALIDELAGTVPIHYGHRLEGIADRLSQIQLVFRVAQNSLSVNASRVVLALPFSTLREVEGLSNLDLNPRKLRAIQGWSYGTNAKNLISFERRFWVNDLRHPSQANIYTDLPTQTYWEASDLLPGRQGILTNFLGGKAGEKTDQRAEKLIRGDLAKLYNHDLPEIKNFKQAYWATSPFQRGSYTCPTVGQYTDLFGVAGEPELGGRLLFAGEHTSIHFAGYMNGAVESGNQVARYIVSTS
ncbi:MAG: NAD(P)/FAD-dependent oxidoreductase [Candidatus Caenarcaniphilales bacterium]|nr:NAD(P)/FAD-dependent oxidoreductase [Candidatus Caenarcaniphilales bacterium]